jgi:hypothetical protein
MADLGPEVAVVQELGLSFDPPSSGSIVHTLGPLPPAQATRFTLAEPAAPCFMQPGSVPGRHAVSTGAQKSKTGRPRPLLQTSSLSGDGANADSRAGGRRALPRGDSDRPRTKAPITITLKGSLRPAWSRGNSLETNGSAASHTWGIST